jgi:hypothetical protein
MTGADRSTPGEDLEMALLEGGIKGSTDESTKGRPAAGTGGRGRPALEVPRAALILAVFGIGLFGGQGCDLDSRLLEGRDLDAGTSTIDTSGGTGGRGTGGHPSSFEPDGSGGRALVGSGGESGSPVADTGGRGAGGGGSASGDASGGAGGTEAPGSGGLPGGSGGAGAGGPGGMTPHASGGTIGASGGAGGAPSTGGRTGSGGVIGSGGATGGVKGSGGVTASGGATATGGATVVGTGGATGPAILSIDFVGGISSTTLAGKMVVIPAPTLDPSESAGVKAARNWNPAQTGSATLGMLTLADGTVSSASVTWNSPASATETGVWRNNLTDAPGDPRMMNGYLDPLSSSAPATVSVSNLPAPFSTRGYDVYVYSEGDIPDTTTRASKYTIGSTSITVSQTGPTPPAVFTGFKRAQNNGSGNYMVFQAVTGGSFTLTATPSSGTPTRAPVNGIQIVSPPGS